MKSKEEIIAQASKYAADYEKENPVAIYPQTASFHGYIAGYDDAKLEECGGCVKAKPTYDEITTHEKWDEVYAELKNEGYSTGSEEEVDKIYDECMRRITKIIETDRQRWTRAEDGLPEDNESVWFYCPKYNAVGAGKFYKKDYFKRENVFISNDGGHYLLEDVSHYMTNEKPLPPLDATTK